MQHSKQIIVVSFFTIIMGIFIIDILYFPEGLINRAARSKEFVLYLALANIFAINVFVRWLKSSNRIYLKNTTSRISNKPPQLAKYLVYLLVPRKNREAILGDLSEDFQEVRKKFGLRKAKFHYWFQVIRSIPSFIGASVIKLLVTSISKAFKASN